MAFTKAYAKILAGMLEGEELSAFRCICGKEKQARDIPEHTLKELEALELIRLDTDLISGKALALLAARGKKVAEFI
jgi:hypothetical protein